MKDQLNSDLKAAMLSGDKVLATTLRGLKGAILNEEIAQGIRDTGLSDPEIITLFSKEAKKRQESADLYVQGDNQVRADAELLEKRVIEQYLPAQISDDELEAVVAEVIQSIGDVTKETMGRVIGSVKSRVGVTADGGRIAAAVKARIS